MELDSIRGCRGPQHEDHHRLQPMQKQERQLQDQLPAATLILHYEEEEPHMPPDSLLQTPNHAHKAMARVRRENRALYGPQRTRYRG